MDPALRIAALRCATQIVCQGTGWKDSGDRATRALQIAAYFTEWLGREPEPPTTAAPAQQVAA